MITTGSPVTYQRLAYEDSEVGSWFKTGILIILIHHATYWEYKIYYEYKLNNGRITQDDWIPNPNVFTDKNEMLGIIRTEVEKIVNTKFGGNFNFIDMSLDDAIDELKEDKKIWDKIQSDEFKQLELF